MGVNQQRESLTTGEVAKLCGVTLRTVINWIQRGHLSAYKLPGTRGDNRITRADLLAFMTQNNMPIPEDLTESTAKVDRESILVVDDDELMANAIARALRATGKRIMVSHSGFEAGLIYAEQRPYLMTLDLQMPRIDGFAVLRSLEGRKHGKILVISAMEDHHLQRALTMGADAILAKPFDNIELVRQVEALSPSQSDE